MTHNLIFIHGEINEIFSTIENYIKEKYKKFAATYRVIGQNRLIVCYLSYSEVAVIEMNKVPLQSGSLKLEILRTCPIDWIKLFNETNLKIEV